jgi:N-methylhydantoinase B/oxoprolinase/acetone carboxylase alpha subunit
MLNGAGDHEDPLDRDFAAVLKDIIGEYLSIEKVHKDYGVVFDPTGKGVDEEQTAQLRLRLRKERRTS